MTTHSRSALSLVIVLPIVTLLIVGVCPALADEEAPAQSQYAIRQAVIGGAGAPMSSSGHGLAGTLAQPSAVGESSSPGLVLDSGFWKRYALDVPTAVSDTPPALVNQLFQNYPNPFNPTTTIRYSLASRGRVSVTIYNVRGQRVRELVNQTRNPGIYRATWDGVNDRGQQVASGVYFYRLVGPRFVASKKMVLLK